MSVDDPSRRPGGPLAATVAGLPRTWFALHAGPPPADDGWHDCCGLLTEAGVELMLFRTSAWLARDHGDVDPAIAPAYLLDWYPAAVAAAAAAPYLLARRVPDVGPDRLALHLHPDGWPDGAALLSPRFACLPEDADAGHPNAHVVPDEAALRSELRERVAAHAGRFLTALGPRGRGRRARWGALTDALAGALWCALDDGGTAAGAAEANRVLPGGTPPYAGAAGFRHLALPGGGSHLTRERVGCCFAYKLDGQRACFTCPRTSDAERVARLLAERAAAPAPG